MFMILCSYISEIFNYFIQTHVYQYKILHNVTKFIKKNICMYEHVKRYRAIKGKACLPIDITQKVNFYLLWRLIEMICNELITFGALLT